MDTSKITSGLTRLYDEGHRIVFWHDPDQEFEETLPSLALDEVSLIRLDECGAFQAKVRIEQQEPNERFLLYAPFEEPEVEQDWLLDIRLYSRTFRADRASIVLDELGLTEHRLRPHLAKRGKFLASKERLNRLKKLVSPGDNEIDLDRKMLAVVVRADQPEFFTILNSLFHGMAEGGGGLHTLPSAWEDMEKYGLVEPFWRLVKTSFGYAEETPNLRNLLIRLMVTDFSNALMKGVPAALQNLVLPETAHADAAVCLDRWRDSSTRGGSFDQLSNSIAEALKLGGNLEGMSAEDLLDVMTFLEVEQHIVRELRDRVTDTADTINVDEVRAIASRRQYGYWASLALPSSDAVPRKALHAVYKALVTAAELFDHRNRYHEGFNYPNAKTMFAAYAEELYLFDQRYRHFCEAADPAESEGWDVLKPLREKVEACYGNWYVTQLALKWNEHLDPEGPSGLLRDWRIEGVKNQQRFFVSHVQPVLDKNSNRKAFVVISDAFRYEAAEELTRELNGKFRFQAELTTQLGVLPSYTGLGMAALLPNEKLTYKPNGDVLVDDMPCASKDQRGKILESVGGIAVKADDLIAMKKTDGRDFIRPHRVIYIYHNKVDAVGDSASTETRTFEAVSEAIEELSDLIRHIINNLNGSYVVVTADHGFLYQETPPDTTDKSAIADKPSGTVRGKKRYLLGHDLPDHEKVWRGSTAVTANADGGMEFWVPKGANRFHFTGGARFVHGGAMPQEIVVPVIAVRELEGKTAEITRVKFVPVHVLGGPHKITTNRHRFQLIQTEAVSERVKPLTLQIGIYEGDRPVTNIETITFDGDSNDMNERTKWVSLSLQGREYDKKTPYQLILRNAETGIEEQRTDVTIDLAIINDF